MHKNLIKIKARYLNSLLEKNIGLIGKKPEAVFFKTRFGIHTFGMQYPIDVLIVDNDFNVVKIKKSLSPSNLFFWDTKYSGVLELPEGTVDSLNINNYTRLLIDLS